MFHLFRNNRQIRNFVIIYIIVFLYWIVTVFYRCLNNTDFSKKNFFYKCNQWCIKHLIHHFFIGYLAPDYIIYALVIGILFEYFENICYIYNKYIDGNVIRDTIINSIGLFIGYITYILFPNNIDLYSYIK